MAMSLSADDEDYDSDSEQVSTSIPCRQTQRGHQRNACARQSSEQHHRGARKWSYLGRVALIPATLYAKALFFDRFSARVCMLVCFCQMNSAIGEGCVYVAQSLRAAIGCFKEEKQRNWKSCCNRKYNQTVPSWFGCKSSGCACLNM